MSWWFMKVKDKLSGNQPIRYQFFTSQVCLFCLAATCNREVFLLLQVLDLWPLTPFGNKQTHTHTHAHTQFCMRAFFFFSTPQWIDDFSVCVCLSVFRCHYDTSSSVRMLNCYTPTFSLMFVFRVQGKKSVWASIYMWMKTFLVAAAVSMAAKQNLDQLIHVMIRSGLCSCHLFTSVLLTAVPPHVWACAQVCFVFPCVFCVSPIRPVRTALAEAVLLLTIAGSRQHVAVIKSKEIGEREGKKKKKSLCGDLAKGKKKHLIGWKENRRQIKWVWKRLVKSRHLWRNLFVLWPENLHAIIHAHTHTNTHILRYKQRWRLSCVPTDAHTPACYSLAQMEKTCTHTHTHVQTHTRQRGHKPGIQVH